MRLSGMKCFFDGLRHAAVAALLVLHGVFVCAAEPFTVVALPDTQGYNVKPQPNLFGCQTEWIVENLAKERIVFVTQLGDLTDNGSLDAYWRNAIPAIETLKGKVPYSIGFGNHEFKDDGLENCKRYGDYKLFQGDSPQGGTSPDGFSFYQLFKAGDFSMLHLSLRMAPDAKTLAWAKGVVRENSGRPAIISTHTYLNVDGRRDAVGEAIWKELVADSPSIFMVLNGHYSGEANLLSSNVDGGKVIQLLSDYQNQPHGGDALLRLIRFIPDAGLIDVKTYSPSLKSFRRGVYSEFSFDAKFNLAGNSIAVMGFHGLPSDFEFPSIVDNPKDQVFSPSAPAVFTVTAKGAAPLRYQWLRNGAEIEGATGTSYSTGEEPPAAAPKPLRFSVKVMNDGGGVTSRKAILHPASQ
jgi:hypothetical protein